MDIEYMRCSLVLDRVFFVGTEEKLCYMIDTSSFEVLDKMSTQSFVFTIEQIDSKTLVCGQY